MPRPVAADYHEKAGQIVAAAGRVFAEKGYERATMADIARAAGFAKATTYHYFGSKEAVLYALLRNSLTDLLTATKQADPGPAADPEQRLVSVIEAYAVAFVERVSVVTPLLLDLSQLRPEWRLEIRRLERELLALLAGVIGTLDPALPPRIAALTVFGAINWTYYWYNPNGDLSAEALAGGMATLLAGGLTAFSTRRREGRPLRTPE
ncbi:MAG: TetR/AcrR family transcriptional regulator [Dehalococcoidia bacterium]